MSKIPLSVLILADRLTKILNKSLQNLENVAEVILIDTSPDSILQKNSKFPKNVTIKNLKVATNPITNFAKVRNAATKLANNDWVLWLDSDEVIVTSSLEEISHLILLVQSVELVSVMRKDVFHGKKLHYGEGNQRIIRLGKKNLIQFKGAVHEIIENAHEIHHSSIEITHFAHESINSFLAKVSKYSQIVAQEKNSTKFQNFFEMIMYPPAKFMMNFFIKLGFLDGWRGFVYAFVMSLHSLFVRVHRHEILQKDPKITGETTRIISFQTLGWIFATVFSLGQLQRIQITPIVSLYAHDLVIALWLLLAGLNYTTNIKNMSVSFISKFRALPLVTKELIGWIGIGMLAAFAQNGDYVPFLYFGRIMMYTAFLATLYELVSWEQLNKIWLSIGLVAGITGILQWILIPDVRFLQVFGWDPHYYRLIGTFFDPAFTGIILASALLLWFYNSLARKSVLVHTLGTGIITIATVLTYSRATYVAIIGAVGVILIFQIGALKTNLNFQTIKKLIYPWVLYGLLAVVTILLAPKPGGEGVNLKRTASIEARTENAKSAIDSISARTFLIGDGLFSLSKDHATFNNIHIDRSRFPDNVFVMLFKSLGVVGVVLIIQNAAKLVKKMFKINPLGIALLVLLVVHAQFQNTLFQPFVFLYAGGSIMNLLKSKSVTI
ncbi:MAG: glycosyltransferase [Microgenomates group bacterium]